ncbi:MAG TPA: 30S ribosomal protein S3 [Candidatus Babeliales bacterium]|nr:30S ribosomal protein S3 [Candidatus Babeliales bacterium]
MGQKVHPIGFRLGIYRDWDARWFAQGNKYGKLIIEDIVIRRFLKSALEKAEVSRIEIEKAVDSIRIIINCGRPGQVIGKKGQEIETLRNQLSALLKKQNIDIKVQEVAKPELDAVLIAQNIATQLEQRVSYKRAMKRAAQTAVRGGAKGIKICCSGRLQGAEIARREWTRVGSVPLHTLRADIDYGRAEAGTTYGIIGVQVWVCKGEYQHIR